MTIETFVFQLTNGPVFSLLLFMSAAGLALIFGLMNVINLAHGSFRAQQGPDRFPRARGHTPGRRGAEALLPRRVSRVSGSSAATGA